MALQFTVALRNARLDAITTIAGASGYLRIYSGTPAVDCAASIGASVLLAELVMNATAFAAAVAGVLTANSIAQDASANASGTATWFRLWKSDGTTAVMQGTVGTSGCDLNLLTDVLIATQPVSVTSYVITEANA